MFNLKLNWHNLLNMLVIQVFRMKHVPRSVCAVVVRPPIILTTLILICNVTI
jgi:hypothetical protein